jgi:type I restriction enzyme, R subunit
LRAWCSRF